METSTVSRNIMKLIGLLYAFNIIYLLKFNPDPHHDGILFSAGYAANEGLIPHRDFNFIWGPLLPYILAVPIKFSSNLFFFRIFGYLVLLLTCYLMYLMAKHFLNSKKSALLAICWLLHAGGKS
jgi:hypothetical protein